MVRYPKKPVVVSGVGKSVSGIKLCALDVVWSTIAARVRSREYWLLICTVDSIELAAEIEERFYSGVASHDFDLFVGPGLFVGISGFITAHKRRMTAADLAAVLENHRAGGAPIPASTFESRDVMFLSSAPENEAVATSVLQLLSQACEQVS